jgi:prolyl-tRNA editing enzyme YbaK/EbsC (Cys-tRNA(Pro) deacylase)
MAIEKVRQFFKQRNMEDRIQEFDVSSATVDLAAQALNCEPKRIAKSLAFKLNERAVLVVAAGDTKVDNSKYKATFGTKAKMLTPDEAIELVGHAAGGICPFAIREDVLVYLDISLKRFKTVFPACGSSNSAMELSIAELEKYSDYRHWVDVCKDWQSELTGIDSDFAV